MNIDTDLAYYKTRAKELREDLAQIEAWIKRHEPKQMKQPSVLVPIETLKAKYKVETLRELVRRGILSKVEQVKTSELRDESRQWRKLIAALNYSEKNPNRIEAESLLDHLGVSRVKQKSGFVFQAF